MNPLQVAQDYADEEGYDWSEVDGAILVWHPFGAARVRPTGSVESESNPRLKAVLEKKITAAWAKEVQLREDPSGRCTIKFSSAYEKMPPTTNNTRLMAVLKVKRPSSRQSSWIGTPSSQTSPAIFHFQPDRNS